MNFFIVMFLQLLYLPNTTVGKTRSWRGIFEKFFFNFALSVIGNYDPVSLQISCRKWDLKKLTEFSNDGKFICNIFSLDTIKIGITVLRLIVAGEM